MIEPFCRLFESPNYGQILAMVQPDDEIDDGYELRVLFRPPVEGVDVSYLAFSYNEDESAGKSAETLAKEALARLTMADVESFLLTFVSAVAKGEVQDD